MRFIKGPMGEVTVTAVIANTEAAVYAHQLVVFNVVLVVDGEVQDCTGNIWSNVDESSLIDTIANVVQGKKASPCAKTNPHTAAAAWRHWEVRLPRQLPNWPSQLRKRTNRQTSSTTPATPSAGRAATA